VTVPVVDFSASAMTLRETEQPSVSATDFREVMSHMAETVCVVTAAHEGQRLGRTATAVLSLSPNPPSVLVSIDLASRLADLIVKSRTFSLAVLASDQAIVGDAFAGKLGSDRFAFGVWGEWPSGNPQLYGASAIVDCELIGSIETQTNVLFAGGIIQAETAAGKDPLVWHRRGYRGLGRR
jgi:flavin reductase